MFNITSILPNIKNGDSDQFFLMAGPCAIEGEDMALQIAEKIVTITDKLNIPYIFKGSYRKANRSRLDSFTGIGDEKALKILEKVGKTFGIPTVTDIHESREAEMAAAYVDVLQIPAFLCRQTELLVAAAKTGKVVNIKKGQFLAPEDMKHVADKVLSTGNNRILLTERGTTFGYHNLVVDMRSLVIMRELGYPVVMDATHAVQLPSKELVSGGQPKFIKPLAKASAAVGIDALFLEVHPDPANALSDAASQLPLSDLLTLLIDIKKIDQLTKNY